MIFARNCTCLGRAIEHFLSSSNQFRRRRDERRNLCSPFVYLAVSACAFVPCSDPLDPCTTSHCSQPDLSARQLDSTPLAVPLHSRERRKSKVIQCIEEKISFKNLDKREFFIAHKMSRWTKSVQIDGSFSPSLRGVLLASTVSLVLVTSFVQVSWLWTSEGPCMHLGTPTATRTDPRLSNERKQSSNMNRNDLDQRKGSSQCSDAHSMHDKAIAATRRVPRLEYLALEAFPQSLAH
jgi:hypothetical protein